MTLHLRGQWGRSTQNAKRTCLCADADGDGTIDSEDACPDDQRKVEPGRCGCGVVETPDCGDVSRCARSLEIGISLDTSGSIGPIDFDTALEQVRNSLALTSVSDPYSHQYLCNATSRKDFLPPRQSANSVSAEFTKGEQSSIMSHSRVSHDLIVPNHTVLSTGDLILNHVILTGSSLGLSCIPTESQRHPLCKDKQVLRGSSPIRARHSPLGPHVWTE